MLKDNFQTCRRGELGCREQKAARCFSVFFFSNASYLLQGVEVLKLPLKDCEAIKGTEFCQVCGGLCLLQSEKRFMLWFHKSPALI